MRPRANRPIHGFALIEAIVAVLIIGIALLALLQIRNQSMYSFIVSGDQHTGAWLAELKMNELISQDLPDPKDNETWELSGSGNFSEYDARVNDLNRSVNERWTERSTFSRIEFEWKKELVFIGPEFIGSQFDLENWEQPEDSRGDTLAIEDPRTKPAVRVVRITLTVYLPERPTESEVPSSRPRAQIINGRPAIRLATYVDPSTLFTAGEEEAAPAPAAPAPANPGGNNQGG